MSNYPDLNALFHAPATMTGADINGSLRDEFLPAVVIYFLPEGFTPDSFMKDFVSRAQEIITPFPAVRWDYGPCSIIGIDGKAYSTNMTRIAFEYAVELDTTSELLMEVIDDALEARGLS